MLLNFINKLCWVLSH